MKNQLYRVTHFDDIPPVACPCGQTRRAFAESPDGPASIHRVETDGPPKVHYHKRLTEIYYILEGQGEMELDGKRFDVRAGSCLLIKPGCRHGLSGQVTFLNVVIPAFDPSDEWFDEPADAATRR